MDTDSTELRDYYQVALDGDGDNADFGVSYERFIVKMAIELRETAMIPISVADQFFCRFKKLISDIADLENSGSSTIACPSWRELSMLLENCVGDTLYSRFDSLFPNARPSFEELVIDSKRIYMIRIVETLKALLKNPLYLKLIFDHNFKGNFFRSRCYDYLSRQSQADCMIFIKLFIDDFEIVNPIGSARGKYKLTGIYFQVLNIPEFLNSQLSHVHLVTVFRRNLFPGAAVFRVLEVIVTELQNLFRHNISDEFPFPVMLAFVCGDNAGIHQAAGLQSHFHAGHVCRHCKVAFNDILSLEASERRDESDYAVGGVGVLSNSPFNDLLYVRRAFLYPPDIMHDFFEGVTQGVICIFFDNIIRNGLMSLETITFR
ncbi:MAG: hypothetical protein AAGK05_15255, partial [Pseudomonadota bacterium]